MPLWPARPRGYSNLSPPSSTLDAQKTAQTLQQRPVTAPEQQQEKKVVSFNEEENENDGLLHSGEKRKKGGFSMPSVGKPSMPSRPSMPSMPSRPAMPSMPSSKRLSMSVDIFHRKQAGATAAKAVKADKPSKPNAKATRQAQAVSSLISGQTATVALSVQGGDPFADPESTEGRDAPMVSTHMSAKQLKQLKSSLVNPKEATQIIDELKRMTAKSGEAHTHPASTAHMAARGACLECTDEEAITKSSKASATDGFSSRIGALSEATGGGIPSVGNIVGQIASSTGAFNALAGVTGRMIDASGSHAGVLTPPADRLSVMVYWWGYELVLPPPTISYLDSVHSVAGTLFTFLQALAMGGGVPELAPFIRYLSMYIDMEWKAIQAQNRGRGVVLAATWVMPVAVVPRAMDFA